MNQPTTGSNAAEEAKRAEEANRLRAWRAIEANLSKRPEEDTMSAAAAVIRRVRTGRDITNVDAVVVAFASSAVEGKPMTDNDRLRVIAIAFTWLSQGCPGPERYGMQASRYVH